MMGGWAIVLALLCFLSAMAVPLFALRWKSFGLVVLIASIFFAWLTMEVNTPRTMAAVIGPFLGGLLLTGFAFGAIARFTMLIGKRQEAEPEEN